LEGRDPLADFRAIQAELESYDESLLDRPMLVVLNKIDLPEARLHLPRLKRAMARRGLPVFPISAATGEGLDALMQAVTAELREIEARAAEEAKRISAEPRVYTLADADERAWSVEQTSRHHFAIRGAGIERFTKMTNFGLIEGAERFQRLLERSGISAELTRLGIEAGDLVHIADIELVWGEMDVLAPPERPKRRTAAERKAAKRR
jgi:GTP-binding protein